MAQSNQPFKRPNLSENEEYKKIPPPSGQESKFVPPNGAGQANIPGLQNNNFPPQQVQPPSQEEINWAIQLEENVQKRGYKPTEQEMAIYQDIANRIVMFQQAQAQRQAQAQAALPPVTVVPKKKSKLALLIKLMALVILVVFFFAKVSIVVLQPSYFTPRGKIYFLIKPVNFSTAYYSVNMDKIYDEKIRKGFTKEDLNIEPKKTTKKKSVKKVNPNWYKDPQYWEDNYIMALPYPKFDF